MLKNLFKKYNQAARRHMIFFGKNEYEHVKNTDPQASQHRTIFIVEKRILKKKKNLLVRHIVAIRNLGKKHDKLIKFRQFY